MRLDGKVALISGACGGIGSAIARRFAHEGANVVLTDLDDASGGALAREITDAGGAAVYRTLDVTSGQGWLDTVAAVVEHFGSLTLLVNNAGIYQRKELVDITSEDWDRMLDVNAKGAFLGTKAAIPAMRASGGGSIVNVSSTAGIRASLAAHYGASKGAVRLLTKSTAATYAKHNIRCNSLHPGPVATEMGYAAVPELTREARLSLMPMGRFGTPEEIANAALFLASDEASFMTGSEMVVDGGATAA